MIFKKSVESVIKEYFVNIITFMLKNSLTSGILKILHFEVCKLFMTITVDNPFCFTNTDCSKNINCMFFKMNVEPL